MKVKYFTTSAVVTPSESTIGGAPLPGTTQESTGARVVSTAATTTLNGQVILFYTWAIEEPPHNPGSELDRLFPR